MNPQSAELANTNVLLLVADLSGFPKFG